MGEQLNDRVPAHKRTMEINDLLFEAIKSPRGIDVLRNYIAEKMEQAYITGAVGGNCNHELVGPDLAKTQFGGIPVAAKLYVKDKGFRI